METWSLPKTRPISCNDCPAFQRLHMSVRWFAESFTRLTCVMNTTFREKIYSRWCCIDRLSRHAYRNVACEPDWPNSHNPRVAASLGPSRTNRLANQQCRVGVLPGDELLRTAAPHFCRVEVAVLVHTELVRSPQPACRGGHRAPRIQQLPVQVEFVELEVAVTIRRPEVLVRGHVDVIRRGGPVAEIPLIEELAILIEDLNAPVTSVVDIKSALVVNGDAVHGIEVVWPLLIAAGLAPLAPGHQEFSGLIKFHDARFLVAIGDEEGAVRQPRNVSLTAEGLACRTGLLDERRSPGIAGHFRISLGCRVQRADRLEQFLAVVAEHPDDLMTVVDGPHPLFWIIRTNQNLVNATLG